MYHLFPDETLADNNNFVADDSQTAWEQGGFFYLASELAILAG